MFGRPCGRLANIDGLCACINAGEFDLVVIRRALFAGPQWVNKVKNSIFQQQ